MGEMLNGGHPGNVGLGKKLCEFCNLVQNKGQDRSLIVTGKTSSLFLNYNQNHKGRCLAVLHKHHETLDDLPPTLSIGFYTDMLRYYQSISLAFRPARVNVALLGNRVSHLHWHLIPRYLGEANIDMPPWPTEENFLDDREFEEVIKTMQTAFEKLSEKSAIIY